MYLLFDIGGTKIRITKSDGNTFDDPKVISTPESFEDGVKAILNLAKEVIGDEKIEAAAGGFPGPWNEAKEIFTNAPNLPNWAGKPLKQKLEAGLGVPVKFQNDAALGALGEAFYGKGKDKKIVVYVTISTGVGGAKVVDKKIVNSAMGFEPGWQVIDAGGTLCDKCDTPGYLIDYVSGKSVERNYGKKAYEITDDDFWDEIAKKLSYGLNNIMVLWSPDIIVLGGSMMNKIGIPVDRVRVHLKEINKIFPDIPEIEKTELGDFVGLYGAMAFVQQNDD